MYVNHTFGTPKHFDNLFKARSHFDAIISSQFWSRKISDSIILFAVTGHIDNSYGTHTQKKIEMKASFERGKTFETFKVFWVMEIDGEFIFQREYSGRGVAAGCGGAK